jgi:hypothetical protein
VEFFFCFVYLIFLLLIDDVAQFANLFQTTVAKKTPSVSDSSMSSFL